MKKITIALFLSVFTSTLFAQALLPTSWSFATTSLPTGWTSSGTNFYTASGHTPPACKFDGTGDYLTIYFASNPGNLTYYLAGNSFSGGTFTVEQSVNGTTWTSLHAFTAPPAGTYTLYTDVPNIASRYIRFFYTNKVTGNIGVDDVNIDAGPAGPQQEINVKQGTSTILNGGTFIPNSPVSTTTPFTFTLQNQGTTTALNITSVTFSGTNAVDFALLSSPSVVNAASDSTIVFNFTPAAAGTRIATMTIVNNDADENPYVINLYGIGGNLASEPTAQGTNLVFTNVKSYRFNAAFAAAAPAPEGYLILKKIGAPSVDLPADGMEYQRGDIVGASTVVYSGTNLSFGSNNIVANTSYNYSVYSYNGSGIYRNYLTASPLMGTIFSANSMLSASTINYTGINSNSSTFITDLHSRINPHNAQFYSNYGPLLVSLFYARDTVDDQRVLTCVYSGFNAVYTEPFDWTANDYSREHSYCHNWMPDQNTALPEYNDYHHLFPTRQDSANQPRSNYPLGEVETVSYTFKGCKIGLDSHGHQVFEPRDDQKGNSARAMFYMCVCYTGVSGNLWSLPNNISSTIPYGEDQNILKKWHFQDPPDNQEIAKNDFIDSLQHNRNPFIDSVDWVCHIDFSNMTWISNPSAPCYTLDIGIHEQQNASTIYTISPNPSEGKFQIESSNAVLNGKTSVRIFDLVGKEVYSDLEISFPWNIDLHSVSSGIYFMEINAGGEKKFEKLIKE